MKKVPKQESYSLIQRIKTFNNRYKWAMFSIFTIFSIIPIAIFVDYSGIRKNEIPKKLQDKYLKDLSELSMNHHLKLNGVPKLIMTPEEVKNFLDQTFPGSNMDKK